ncbi:MAG: hypothetical protein OXE95_03010 [Chloroflexi bacterium]|nr:hypothetical protein [Chloroflexota bacterium]MCY4246533.1 hypothetical protein [Chloroflexota bacterium]
MPVALRRESTTSLKLFAIARAASCPHMPPRQHKVIGWLMMTRLC